MGDHVIKIAPRTIFLTVFALIVGYLFIQFLSAVRFVILVFLLALVFAQAVETLVRNIERLRIGRVTSIVLAYLIVFQFFLLLGAIIVPPLILQLQALALNLPLLFERLQELLSAYYTVTQPVASQLQEAINQLATNLAQLLPSLLLLPFQVTSIVVAATMTLVISFYWLLVARHVKLGILRLLPLELRAEGEEIIAEMGRVVGGWVRGQMILSASIGLFTFVGLTLLNIPFAVLLAVWAAVTELIPMVGPVIGAIPAVVIAFMISPFQALLVAVFYFVVQQVENHLLVPNVMHREVGLHPLLVILALLTGAELMGIIGALLAIPIVAALQVLVVHIVRHVYKEP